MELANLSFGANVVKYEPIEIGYLRMQQLIQIVCDHNMKPANVSQCGIAASDLYAAIPHMTSSYEHAYHWSNCYRGALEEDRPALSIPFSRSPALLTQRKAGWVSIIVDADAMYLVKTRRAFSAYTITPIMPWEGSLALH